MKNNFIFFFVSIFIFLFNINIALSDDFNFKASEIIFLENGNLIKAKNGTEASTNDGMIIKSDEFEYDKIKNILIATGDVKVFDSENELTLNAPKISYFKNSEIIITEQKTIVLIKNQFTLNSKDIIFDRKKMEVISKYKSDINDNFGNLFYLDAFKYWIKNKSLKANKIKLITNMKNEFLFENAMINLNTNEVVGKDIKVNFSNDTFDNTDNQPRLKGNIFYSDTENTNISKGVFTTCKKRDGCPPWVISASKIRHNKSKKTIHYKDAWLKIYDIPVLYFPKFFHPDPTVKRQTGFLIPQIINSNNLGASLTLPYYNVISESKDFTFSPRYFNRKKYLLQSEYRSVGKHTKNTIDTSILQSDEDENTSSHFFSNSFYNLGLSGFDSSFINLDIKKTSNINYLKKYKLKSTLMDSASSLNSILNFEANRENLSVKTSLEAYENLSEPNSSDRYEFVFPNINILKTFNTMDNLNGNLSLNTSGHRRQYNTNTEEIILINNLLFKSNPLIQNSGFKNGYTFLLRNVNSDAEKSNKYKDSNSHKMLSTFLLESSFPLKKKRDNFNSLLTPKISFRYSPNPTKNMSTVDRRIGIDNIFSLDRVGVNDAVEGGESLTIGNEYKITNKNNDERLLLNLATVYRDKNNVDLPKRSTLNKKKSDVIGNLKITPNNFLDFDYNFSLDHNLETLNYNSINTSLTVNKFVTSFEFLEENDFIGGESYIGNKTSYSFNDDNTLKFSTRKNKRTNLTEFYNLIYEYKNDCLVAGIEYNKDYYNIGDAKPEEQIFFSITIVPFGKTTGPNVNK